MDFITADEAKVYSLINLDKALRNIDVVARGCVQEQIRTRVDRGGTKIILPGSSHETSGVPFNWINPDTKSYVIIHGGVLDEFRALVYRVEVKCFPLHPDDPPNGLLGQYDVHLIISWE